MKSVIAILLVVFLLISCDKGIEPYPEPVDPENTGIAGTVNFIGTWPSGIARTHIVLFKNAILSEADFFPPNLSYVSNEIDSGTVVLEYDSRTNNLLDVNIAPGTYRYIVVAQSTKDALSLDRKDWFVVGVFYAPNDNSKPGSIIVNEGRVTENVNIICDFDNPPPQPPGG
ncbi:hypothetical protein ASZ90_003850 [hydrocarbon metagenome]|uniref:Uncharacterized protein n=1 Tax=hydrocarbon metagenome TaxID=938273 RepID=A0A0W8FZH0_9ZZZZ